MKTKFFLKLLLGLIIGTIGHEFYHLIAGHGRLIFTDYGVGVVSKNGSSEVIAYLITFFIFILSFIIAKKDLLRSKISFKIAKRRL